MDTIDQRIITGLATVVATLALAAAGGGEVLPTGDRTPLFSETAYPTPPSWRITAIAKSATAFQNKSPDWGHGRRCRNQGVLLATRRGKHD